MLKINIDKLLNIIIIGLCVAMVICIVAFFKEYKYTSSNYYSNDDYYIYYIGEKKYSELLYRMYHRDYSNNPKKELKEPVAIAEYYKNTSFYKMYHEIGDVAKAEEYLAKMERNKEDIGELSFVIPEINGELSVEQ